MVSHGKSVEEHHIFNGFVQGLTVFCYDGCWGRSLPAFTLVACHWGCHHGAQSSGHPFGGRWQATPSPNSQITALEEFGRNPQDGNGIAGCENISPRTYWLQFSQVMPFATRAPQASHCVLTQRQSEASCILTFYAMISCFPLLLSFDESIFPLLDPSL